MSSLETTVQGVARLAKPDARVELRKLVVLLGDEDWQTRRAAAAAISSSASAGETSAAELEELLADLVEALNDGIDAGRRAAAIAALEGIIAADETRAPALRHIAAAVGKASHTVRIGLAGVVGAAGGREAVALLAPLADDAETNVAAAAIAALGRTCAPEATPLLLNYLDSDNDWLRFAATGALGELGDARAVSRLELSLEDQLLQEAAAAALSEIATVESACVLARHLRAKDGALRPAVLKALVSVATDERALPNVIARRIYETARRLFREACDEEMLAELMRTTSMLDPSRVGARIIALGWSGDARALSIIARAHDDPATTNPAQLALAALADEPSALREMLAAPPELLPRSTLAAALTQVCTLEAVEAAARLGVEAADAETLEASRAALAYCRERVRQKGALALRDEAARLSESLRRNLGEARGELLIEIAETLGMLVADLPGEVIEEVGRALPSGDEETETLARLAFFDCAGRSAQSLLGMARRAQRHQSARLRIRAIEIEVERAGGNTSFVSHLADESAGVRRAAARAMRRVPNQDARRELLAALADEDIWVMAETIVTLGLVYGRDGEVRARLSEALAAPHPLCRVAAAEALSTLAETPEDWRTLAHRVRRDTFAEVRHAAMLAFAHCPQPRTVLSAARAALKDEEWPVRRAAVETLTRCSERPALRLLLDAASKEETPVRRAALRALAARHAPETVALACRAIAESDAALIEDAYAALLPWKSARPDELRAAQQTCAPRAAAIIAFILSEDESSEK